MRSVQLLFELLCSDVHEARLGTADRFFRTTFRRADRIRRGYLYDRARFWGACKTGVSGAFWLRVAKRLIRSSQHRNKYAQA